MIPNAKKPASVEEPKIESPAPAAPVVADSEPAAPAPIAEPTPAAEPVKSNIQMETIVGHDNSVRHIAIPNVF